MSLVIYDIVINSEVYTFSCPDRFILKITRSREEIKISYDFDFKGHQGHQVIKGYPSLLVTASTLSNFIIMKNQNEFFLSCSIQTSLSSQVEAI